MNDQQNKNEDFLKNLSGEKNPFQVPESYFEELQGIIKDRISALPENEKPSSINPFVIPNGYFEKLPAAISDKVLSTERNGRITFLYPRIKYVLAAAIVLIAIGLIYMANFQTKESEQLQLTAEELKNSTIIYSIDEDIIVDVLASQNIKKSDQSLEQYLIDHDIELSQLENAL